MKYDKLLDEATSNGVYVIENANFESDSDGLINKDVIGINRKIKTTTQKACVLAEELGHYHTTTGNIIDLKQAINRKQEHRARVWAYNKMIGLMGLIRTYEKKCHDISEMASHLDVTEEFLKEAISYYSAKYGTHAMVDNYIVFFAPSFGVLKLI